METNSPTSQTYKRWHNVVCSKQSAPSNHKFYAFTAQIKPHFIPDNEEEEEQARHTMVSGDKDEEEIVTTRTDKPIAYENQRESSLSMTSEIQREKPIQIEFMDNEIQDQVNGPKDVTSKQAALQKCHNRLNHMSFARIQAMAKYGLLPKYLADVEPPVCASCAYGKATRQPWREKGTSTSKG
jgi:hypothetical protein